MKTIQCTNDEIDDLLGSDITYCNCFQIRRFLVILEPIRLRDLLNTACLSTGGKKPAIMFVSVLVSIFLSPVV